MNTVSVNGVNEYYKLNWTEYNFDIERNQIKQ